MNMSKYLSINEIAKLHDEQTDSSIKCKNCGHVMNISNQRGKRICTHCGYYVFANDKEEFKYRLMSAIKESK